MTDAARPWRYNIAPLLLPRLILWSVLSALLSYTAVDPDLWGHTRFGMDVVDAGALPAVDTYSFTTDRPWVNHEWLSEVVMGLAYRAGGAVGLALLKFFLLAAAFALILRELSRRGVPPMAQDLLLALAIVGCFAIVRTLRPQTFSLLLFAGFLIAVRRAEDGDRRSLWLIPAIMPLWPNLHGGWLVGIGIYGVWTAVRCLWPIGVSRIEWAAAGIAAVIATLLNPEGLGMWRFLWETVGLSRSDIVEWQPLTRRTLGDALPWIVSLIVAAIAFVRTRGWRATHMMTVLILAFVAFRVARVVPFLVLAVVVLLGPRLAAGAMTPAKPPPGVSTGALLAVAAVALVFCIASAVAAVRNLSCISMTGVGLVDQQAAAFIRDTQLSGRMLTWFDWGEYAIWFLSPRIRVSIDGRRETIYSDEALERHYAIYRGAPGWQDALKRIDPDHIWLPTSVPTLQEIGQMGWRRVFHSDRSEVLSRTAVAALAAGTTKSDQCFPGTP